MQRGFSTASERRAGLELRSVFITSLEGSVRLANLMNPLQLRKPLEAKIYSVSRSESSELTRFLPRKGHRGGEHGPGARQAYCL